MTTARVKRTCIDCERPIGQMRLRAVPDAVRCPNCAERHEYLELEAGRGPLYEARRRAENAMAAQSDDALAILSGRV